MRLLRLILVFGACLHLTGGHFGVLQVIAWSRMIVDYSAAEGLLTGARKTFDGAHPCEMCASIAEAKKQERENDSPASAVRDLGFKELQLPRRIDLLPPRSIVWSAPSFADPASARSRLSSGPEAPPPRSAV